MRPGLVLLGVLLFLALAGPALAPHDPVATHVTRALEPPSREYPLGTDALGRCALSRLLAGSPVTLGAVLIVEAIVFTAGTAVGLCAGYLGGPVDALAVAVTDTLFAFPSLILALVLAGLSGGGIGNLVLVFSAVYWVEHARLARALVRAERPKDYVAAARVLGIPARRIMLRHLLPNVLPPLLVNAALASSQIVVGLSALSFLGLGVKPPAPEWGALIAEGRDNPYLMAAATLCVTLAAACGQCLAERRPRGGAAPATPAGRAGPSQTHH